MIVVDTSALIAILRAEPEAEAFARVIAEADGCAMISVSPMEASIVMAGRSGNSASWTELEELISQAGIDVIAQDRSLTDLARDAVLRFGNGRHPAALNMSDCESYALAKARGLPLLFKGNDFGRTDLTAAARSGAA